MSEQRSTDLLIVGAGPFGLALAACAGAAGLEYLIVGRPMEFWQAHMPAGMLLRSGADWHLDPLNVETIDAYLQTLPSPPAAGEPLSLDFYLGYAAWFQRQKAIQPLPALVQRLDWDANADGGFTAVADTGVTIAARRVVLAVGFEYFAQIPDELAAMLPSGSYEHTCDAVDPGAYRGKRVLIVGGRQSAFEWAALLREAGASRVEIAYRHETPAFAESDWSWVNPLVEDMASDPGWFRRLSAEEQDRLRQRFWAEGRLKLEPWLPARLGHEIVRLWPQTQVVSAEADADGGVRIGLSNGTQVGVDRVILATGYRVDLERIPFLAAGNLLPQMDRRAGSPVLTDHLQTSVPGLYMTSLAAAQDFGPFFGFTVSVRTAAKLIVEDLAARAAPASTGSA